ncbi:PTS system mannose/fructose/N-acetylgalactosamine-transporter subunit IIB [Dielma fastidiosa]|uniref:PTS sugar transporter subunit IIB n=1 Tax=Dielma fastidiosa TaxID=1034346 RepID=A0AB35UJI9_9FIRM|nr:PTS sugar transporter subunit IIB [Dielma fastidiosa]MDY5166828.1 PTS sugar transporter subunit IIB [Dielma fastidiosa]
MSIVLARVDDRLIHGQVMTSWLNYTGATKIVVIDDVTANDSFLTMIIKTLVPANIKTEVVREDACIAMVQALDERDKVIMLAKTPAPYVMMAEAGISLDKVNIGGMGIKPGRKTIYKNISASEEEVSQLKALLAKKIAVEIQMVAEDPAIDVSKYI